MSLAPGTRLGPYEITAQIGAGGMGEVYRARDTKLHRSVAIKALPDSFASDSGRLSRFEREARVLASLNHPHIAQIYGLEAQDTRSFIVMELVEGETLTEWIARQPKPPIDEALLIARQIAEALEAAHEQGIIHRDLKPANITVKSDGTVKVLDFGLARAEGAANAADNEQALTNSPTMTSPAMTQAGVILGTAAYMAPEQAKGKPVDKRADIWAFGCVLFEMLTGRPVFNRETVTETLAAVMRDAPPFDALAATTPPHVRRLLGRCLERDSKRRLRDIGEARLVLEGGSDGIAPPVLLATESARRPRWLTVLPWAVALASIATLVVVERGRRVPSPVAPPLSKIVVPLPEPLVESGRPIIALSPNGHRLAFVATHDRSSAIYLRDVDGFDARPLADTENTNSIFFSPDGEWIGFYASGRLKKVSVRGGPPVTLASTTDHWGATWTGSGTIIATTRSPGLIEVPEGGGESRTVAPSKTILQNKALPHALPDGRTVL